MRTLTIILTIIQCLALAQCGLSPAWAQTVEVPDVAPDYAEGGPEDMEFVTANAGGDLAMLYQVPTTPADGLWRPAPASTLPLSVQAASGGETRLSVDVGAANAMADREGWSTWQKWTVIGVCVVAAAVAGVLIVDATQHHGDTSGDNSSTNIHVPGNGNTININSPNHPSTTTTTTTQNGW